MKYISLIILVFFLSHCADKDGATSVKTNYNCLLDRITTTDTLYITYKYKGCFDQNQKFVKVFRNSDTLFSTFAVRQLDSNYFFSSYLTDSSIQAYKNLETYISRNKMGEGLCTTTATITILIQNDSLKYIDQSCSFDLYSNFLRKTFKIPRPK